MSRRVGEVISEQGQLHLGRVETEKERRSKMSDIQLLCQDILANTKAIGMFYNAWHGCS